VNPSTLIPWARADLLNLAHDVVAEQCLALVLSRLHAGFLRFDKAYEPDGAPVLDVAVQADRPDNIAVQGDVYADTVLARALRALSRRQDRQLAGAHGFQFPVDHHSRGVDIAAAADALVVSALTQRVLALGKHVFAFPVAAMDQIIPVVDVELER